MQFSLAQRCFIISNHVFIFGARYLFFARAMSYMYMSYMRMTWKIKGPHYPGVPTTDCIVDLWLPSPSISLSFSAPLYSTSMRFPLFPKTITFRTKGHLTQYNITALEGTEFEKERFVGVHIDGESCLVKWDTVQRKCILSRACKLIPLSVRFYHFSINIIRYWSDRHPVMLLANALWEWIMNGEW